VISKKLYLLGSIILIKGVKYMENSNKYQLTCAHCGEFISINNIPTNENIVNDSSVGEIKISNVYTGYGTTGCYNSMDIELTCPRCHYTFKATVSKNSNL
jgi:protein-arginine kinase activator protein McsA